MNQPIMMNSTILEANTLESSLITKIHEYRQTDYIYDIDSPIVTDTFQSDNTKCFKVSIRIRPLNKKELACTNPKKRQNIIKKQDNMVFIFDPDICFEGSRKERQYIFDDVFDQNDSTITIYKQSVLSILDSAVNGYNSTIFAYGMTGAGKTYTMFGDITNNEPGITLLAVKDLFKKFSEQQNYKFTIKLTYLEIYNETVRDLLLPKTENLMIVEDPIKGVYIPNLIEVNINALQDIIEYINTGNNRRITSQTLQNNISSRSHAILQLLIHKYSVSQDIIVQSKLSFIDLAGSEKTAGTSHKNQHHQYIEGSNINKSLLALGNCINILSDPTKRGAYVPYRDSKLTRLLKDSLGGNTKTTMIACISPSYQSYEETANTLKYASRARFIKRKILKNIKGIDIHISEYKNIIEQLKLEIDYLKIQLHQIHKSKSQQLQQQYSTTTNQTQEEDICILLLSNLEENWEIKQTIKDLDILQSTNYSRLNELQALQSSTEQNIVQEIQEIQDTISHNHSVLIDIRQKLQKNEEEMVRLKSLVYSSSNYSQLETTYHILNNQKMQLHSQNLDIKTETISLNKENQARDFHINQMAKELQYLKQQLLEKDIFIAKNKDTISKLKKDLNESTRNNQQVSKQSYITEQFSPNHFKTESNQIEYEFVENPMKNIDTQEKHKNIKNNRLIITKRLSETPKINLQEKQQKIQCFFNKKKPKILQPHTNINNLKQQDNYLKQINFNKLIRIQSMSNINQVQQQNIFNRNSLTNIKTPHYSINSSNRDITTDQQIINQPNLITHQEELLTSRNITPDNLQEKDILTAITQNNEVFTYSNANFSKQPFIFANLMEANDTTEIYRIFKNKLYTFNEIVENGYLSNNLCEDILLLLQEYQTQKYNLSQNDQLQLMNLQNKIGNHINNKTPKNAQFNKGIFTLKSTSSNQEQQYISKENSTLDGLLINQHPKDNYNIIYNYATNIR